MNISFMIFTKMSRKSVIVILVIFWASGCKSAISDKRLCGDPTCSEPVSYAKTLVQYASADARILSFQKNVIATIYSKSAGSRPDLWGVEINGKRGYAPKNFLREYKVVKGSLVHEVSTKDVSPSDNSEGPTTTKESDTLQMSSEEIKEVVPTTETLKPYEVVDGTTIYLNTEVPVQSLDIKATTTESKIEPTLQSQPDLKTGDIDTPQSITLNDEKDEGEGSTGEKIYNYLISNFMTEEASGESDTDRAAPSQVVEDKESEEGSQPVDPLPSSQNILIESTESSNIPPSSEHSSQPEPSTPPPTANRGERIMEAMSLFNGSAEVEDEDEEDSELEEEDDEEDEDFGESEEDMTSSDQGNLHSNDKASLDPSHSSPGTDNGHKDSVSPVHTEVENSTQEVSNTEHGLGNQSSTLETQPSDMVIKDQPKAVEPELSIASAILTNGNPTDSSVQPELQSDASESKNLSGKYLETPENERPDIQNNGNSDDNNNTIVFNNLPDDDSKIPVRDLGDNPKTETIPPVVEETLNVDVNPTVSTLGEEATEDHQTNTNDDPLKEPFKTTENNLDKMSGIGAEDSMTAKNVDLDSLKESVGRTAELKGDPVHTENEVLSESTSNSETNQSVASDSDDATEANIYDTSQVVYETTERNPVLMEEQEFFEDESALTTSLPDDYSTSKITDIEDSTLSDVEMNVDDTMERSTDASEEGFISRWFSSLFGSSSSNAVEDIDSDTEDSARNSAWSSVHSYTKQVEDTSAETPSSCLAESGIIPDCDNVLLTGTVPRVAADNEAVLEQIIPEQGASGGSRMDTWDYGGSYGTLSYLGIITAISAVVVILGHWFIEKMRCDSTFIKRINELERDLLYAELESKNLKIDLEETQQQVVGAEESETVSLLQEQLKTAHEIQANLEEKICALEEKNASLQSSLDAATEAGLELNRMLSELLTANKGSEALIGSVNDLQQQLNFQQTTINNMKMVLTTKEAESEGLRNNITTLQSTINSLERELNQMTETLNEVLVEKATHEAQFKSIKEDLDAKLQAMSDNESQLLKDISNLRSNIFQIESVSCTQGMELVLLQQYIENLKKDGKSEENQSLKDLFNVAKAKTLNQQLITENNKLVDDLAGEKDARQLLEAHVDVVTKEVEALRKAFEQSEKEKNEAVTKHAVLADYFKDKESQLHKELGYRDALYMKTKGDATSIHEEVKSLQEQLESYKLQIDSLKKEITDQERGLKSQILAFEKKSHENWLAARQAERKLQEARLEAGQLRNRLTMMEKTSSNLQNDKPPIVVANDREPLDPSSSVSPQLYPVEVGDLHPFAPRVQPVAASPLGSTEEPMYHTRSNHASPALPRPHPTLRVMPPRKSPAAPPELSFTVDEARDPASPFFGILNPSAPFDPYYGRPIQDRHNPDLYHLIPLVPYLQGSAPLILPPPPVLPNDRRPPPLGRMSSPPVDRPSPPALRHYILESPVRVRSFPLDRVTPPERVRGRVSPSPPRHHRPRRRPSVDSTGRTSPFDQPSTQERGRRRSPTPRSMYDHSISRERTPSPEHRRPYRRRSRSPSGRYSDSSPDSGPENSRYARRYDYSPESSYRGRSRTPSPTSFRPISREPSNNQGSNRSSNQSYESDESNRRGGRV